jgi:hypothetical protein
MVAQFLGKGRRLFDASDTDIDYCGPVAVRDSGKVGQVGRRGTRDRSRGWRGGCDHGCIQLPAPGERKHDKRSDGSAARDESRQHVLNSSLHWRMPVTAGVRPRCLQSRPMREWNPHGLVNRRV